MGDHYHPLPVCGIEDVKDEHDDCENRGRRIACGTIVDPTHARYGDALCRHRDPEVLIKICIFALVLFLFIVEWFQFELRIVELVIKVLVLVLLWVIIRMEWHLRWPKKKKK